MAFISFNYNKNLKYAISYWAVEIILRSLIYLERDPFQIFKKDSINEYAYMIQMNVGDLLSFFLVVYIYCSFKKKDNNEFPEINNNNSKFSLISNDNEDGIFYFTKPFLYKLIGICLLDYLNRSAFYLFYQTNTDATHADISHKAQFDIINHIDIIARYILSIILLKTKVFKHHKLSIYIILIGFIILIPTDAISIHLFSPSVDESLTYLYIGYFSFRGILLPLEDIFQKKLFLKYYIYPEHLMFFRGLGELIIFILLTPIFYFAIWNKDPEYLELASSIWSIITVTIIYTLSSFIKSYLVLKVIYYFSSQSVSFLIISESITGSLADIIHFFISDNRDSVLIVFLLIDIIVIIITATGTLIYDEILVIKKWGFDLNIAHEISTRALKEFDSLERIDTDEENEIDDIDSIDERKKSIEFDEY